MILLLTLKIKKNSSKASDARARNLRTFSSKYLHLHFGEQYSNNMTPRHNCKILNEKLHKFLALCHQS